jgi:hypothetical protein
MLASCVVSASVLRHHDVIDIQASLLTTMVTNPTMTTDSVDDVIMGAPLALSSSTETSLQLSPMQQAATQSVTSKVVESIWITELISSNINILISSLHVLRHMASFAHDPNAVEASSFSSLELMKVAEASTLRHPACLSAGQAADGGLTVIEKPTDSTTLQTTHHVRPALLTDKLDASE